MKDMLNEVRDLLKITGLTDNEIKIYVTLLVEGPLTAKEISIKTGIPYAKIYSHLEKLRRKELLEKSSERPAKYIAKTPYLIYTYVKRKVDEELAKLRRIVSLMEHICMSEGSSSREIHVIFGLNNVISTITLSLLKAKKQVLMAVSNIPYEQFKELISILRELRGECDIRLLVSQNYDIKRFRKDIGNAGIELKVKDEMFGNGLIVDERETVIVVKDSCGEYVGIVAKHKHLVDIARTYYEFLWGKAKYAHNYS